MASGTMPEWYDGRRCGSSAVHSSLPLPTLASSGQDSKLQVKFENVGAETGDAQLFEFLRLKTTFQARLQKWSDSDECIFVRLRLCSQN